MPWGAYKFLGPRNAPSFPICSEYPAEHLGCVIYATDCAAPFVTFEAARIAHACLIPITMLVTFGSLFFLGNFSDETSFKNAFTTSQSARCGKVLHLHVFKLCARSAHHSYSVEPFSSLVFSIANLASIWECALEITCSLRAILWFCGLPFDPHVGTGMALDGNSVTRSANFFKCAEMAAEAQFTQFWENLVGMPSGWELRENFFMLCTLCWHRAYGSVYCFQDRHRVTPFMCICVKGSLRPPGSSTKGNLFTFSQSNGRLLVIPHNHLIRTMIGAFTTRLRSLWLLPILISECGFSCTPACVLGHILVWNLTTFCCLKQVHPVAHAVLALCVWFMQRPTRDKCHLSQFFFS